MRPWIKFGLWLVIIVSGSVLGIVARETLGAEAKGWVNGASVCLGTWWVMCGMLPDEARIQKTSDKAAG